MPLIGDVRASFRAKGMEFVSLTDAGNDRTLLTYREGGESKTKEIGMRLSDLEETVEALDVLDPKDLANYLLSLK